MMKRHIKTIKIFDLAGHFAENKDTAKEIRENMLWPEIKNGNEVMLDFDQIEDVTQSFIHALLSQLIRETQGQVLDFVYFKNCNETVKKIVNMVVDYMSEG